MQARGVQWAWLQSWQEYIYLHNKLRFHTPDKTMISSDGAMQYLLLQMGQCWQGMMRASWGWDRSEHSGKWRLSLDGERWNSEEITYRALICNLRRENDRLGNGSPAEINLGLVVSWESSMLYRQEQQVCTAEVNKVLEVITLLCLVLFSWDIPNSFEHCVSWQTGAADQGFGLLFQQLNFYVG